MRFHTSRKPSTRRSRLRGCRPSTQYLEALESRVLLSVTFANADVSGLWHYAGTSVEGAIQFDGSGHVITGSLLHADGSTTGASGTYAIHSDGTLSLVTPAADKFGGMNASKDVITLTDNSTHQALSVLVSAGSTTFSKADLSGTWNFGVDGDTSETSGFGTISLDGAGSVTGGSITNGLGTATITGGAYTVRADGATTLSLTLLNPDSSVGTANLTGALNASGDLLAMNPPDLQEAIAEPAPRLVVLVKSSGSYSDSDGAGTWLLSADGRTGYITLDGAGNVTGGIIHHSDGTTTVPSGNYTISSTGALTVVGGSTTFTGAMNAAHNAIVMSSTDADNLNILLVAGTPLNHAPTLSTIRQLGPASAGVPLTITYADLAAAGNASDVDGDALQYRITALGSGTLALNGNTVTSLPALVSAGDTLTWTAPATASGALTAFSIQAFDGTLASGTDVPVVVGTGPFSAGTLSGNWTVAGTAVEGTVQFDGAGGITGGSLTDNTGASATPSGNYSIAPRGTIGMTLDSTSQIGVINSTQDVVSITDKNQGNSLALLVRGNGAAFSNADLTGSWTIETNGDSPDANGSGTLLFDGAGHITGGSFVSGNGLQTGLTGNYTVNADGTCTVNVITPSGSGGTHTLTFVGALNGSKDLLAASNANLQTAGANGDSNLVVLVHSSGAYSLADAAGTWLLATEGGGGAVTIDGAGHITDGFFKDTQGDVLGLSGNVTMTSGGVFTATVQGFSNGSAQHMVVTGVMNAARNVVAANQVSLLSGGNLSTLTKIANHAPALTGINPLGTASAGKPFTFTYNDLANAANLADADGDTLSFAITSIGPGTLMVNDNVVTTLPVGIKSGDAVVWTPPVGASGAITAFTVEAFDGIATSATAVGVTIDTVPFNGNSVAGAWTFAGSSAEGSIEFDNAGFITSGSLTQNNGVVQTPSGMYTVNSDGTLTLNSSFGAQSGAMNATRDLIAMANNTLDHTLAVLVNPGGADFANTDLAGNWTLEFNGPTPDSNGNGTITFDGAGAITGGSLTSGTGTQAITGGTYTVSGSGTVNVTITAGTSLSFVGALNSAKDLAALNPPDLQAAATANASNLLIMVRSSGAYTVADAAGTWTMFTEGGQGTFTVDATGNLTSGTFTDFNGSVSALTGAVSVAANGQLTLNGTLTTNGSAQAVTATGIINASRNAIVQNTVGTSSSGALAVMIQSTNHAPTLTTVGPLGPMTAGKPVTITYAGLLAAGNAGDADHDPIQFQVTSVDSGVLTLNGAAVTSFPKTVSAGDVLVWSPPNSATGNIAAFSVMAFDGVAASATPVSVAVNMAVFTNNDIGGNWVFAGTGADGGIAFDSNGNIVDGSLNFSDGSTGETPTGSYTLQSPSGAVTISLSTGGPAVSAAGGMNGTRDVIAATDSSNGGTLSVLVSPGSASFTNADLSGTWFLAFNGDTPDSNGLGSVIFDGAGRITGGSATTGKGTKSILGGDYSVNSDGTCAIHITVPSGTGAPHTMTFVGALNASKDVLALDPPDLQQAANNTDSNLTLLVHSSGAYTTADAAGTWTIAGNGSFGSVTVDAGGHVTSGTLLNHHGTLTLGGSITVAGNGKFTFNAVSTSANGTETISFTGSLNASRNTAVLNHVENSTRNGADNLTVLVRSGNHAPTLTTVQTLATALSGKPFAITYDALKAASNENDIDGDPIQFIITAGGTGALAVDGNAVSSFPITVSAGDTVTWTPPATSSGTINAFSIKASDGIASSSVAVPVRVTTALQAATSIAATKQASEINAATTGKGVFTITRANGNLTAPLTVDFAISGNAALTSDYALTSTATLSVDGSAQTGNIIIPAGQKTVTINVAPVVDGIAEGPQAVILTLTASSDYNVTALKGQASITIADSASTLAVAATKPAASEINGATSGAGVYTFTRAGGDLSGPLTVDFSIGGTAVAGTNYTVATAGGTVTFDNGSSTGTVTFAAGKPSATVTLNPLDDGVANTPALAAVLTIQSDAGPSYLINAAGGKNTATVKIADAASTLAVAATKPAASEINGATSGAGVYTFTRSGGNLTLPLTVDFSIGGHAVAGTNYTVASAGGTVIFDNSSGNGTVTFAAGKSTATVTLNPLNDGVANNPALTALLTIQPDANPSYFINSSKNTATVKIADAASTISVAATKPAASEINGTTSGAGVYTFTRTGGNLGIPLTVSFGLTGNATAGVDYNVVTSGNFSSGNGTGTVIFAAGKSTATVTLNPIDDVVTDPGEQVILTLVADPSYFNNPAKATGTVTIADDTRPIFFTAVSPVTLSGASKNTAFTISYATLVAATGVLDHAGLGILFKIAGKLSGTLVKNAGTAIVLGSTPIGVGDTLTWTPATNAVGTLSAFTVVATDLNNTTPTAMAIRVIVT